MAQYQLKHRKKYTVKKRGGGGFLGSERLNTSGQYTSGLWKGYKINNAWDGIGAGLDKGLRMVPIVGWLYNLIHPAPVVKNMFGQENDDWTKVSYDDAKYGYKNKRNTYFNSLYKGKNIHFNDTATTQMKGMMTDDEYKNFDLYDYQNIPTSLEDYFGGTHDQALKRFHDTYETEEEQHSFIGTLKENEERQQQAMGMYRSLFYDETGLSPDKIAQVRARRKLEEQYQAERNHHSAQRKYEDKAMSNLRTKFGPTQSDIEYGLGNLSKDELKKVYASGYKGGIYKRDLKKESLEKERWLNKLDPYWRQKELEKMSVPHGEDEFLDFQGMRIRNPKYIKQEKKQLEKDYEKGIVDITPKRVKELGFKERSQLDPLLKPSTEQKDPITNEQSSRLKDVDEMIQTKKNVEIEESKKDKLGEVAYLP